MTSPSTLLLRLGGPLQAWGDQSRFERRTTRPEPTKSGILGLIAAAQGRSREDDLTDLGVLGYGVRVEQEGQLVRDYQTAQRPDSVLGKGWANPKLSYRYYLADALFLVGVQGDRTLLEGIAEAIRSPEFPLYLGRRSCPPSRPILHVGEAGDAGAAIMDGDVATVLAGQPWIAEPWYRKKQPETVRLRLVRDARPEEVAQETVRDVPVSFSSERRSYVWRGVVHEEVTVENPRGNGVRGSQGAILSRASGGGGLRAGGGFSAEESEHDPMEEL